MNNDIARYRDRAPQSVLRCRESRCVFNAKQGITQREHGRHLVGAAGGGDDAIAELVE